jgi:hypothetical protein
MKTMLPKTPAKKNEHIYNAQTHYILALRRTEKWQKCSIFKYCFNNLCFQVSDFFDIGILNQENSMLLQMWRFLYITE